MKRTVAFLLCMILLLSACQGDVPEDPSGGSSSLSSSESSSSESSSSESSSSESSSSESSSSEGSSSESSSSESSSSVSSSENSQSSVAPPVSSSQISSSGNGDNMGPVFDVDSLVNSLTLEEKVGQLFLVRCPATNALEDIQTYHLGGYVLFAPDFEHNTPQTMKELIASYQSRSAIPLLIAVDEEGGTVNRVSKFSQYRETPFPSPRNLYAQGGLTLIAQTEVEKCQLLKSLGINLNLAPVCDITTDESSFMYNRSLGQNPLQTGRFVSMVLGVMRQHSMGGILKHFPGYGNNTDTHIGIALDNRPLETLESEDLVPFAAGIRSGCDAIMVSHTFVNALDPDYPASLSTKVHDYLRNEMGFDGIIATDDLFMKAITDEYGTAESAVLAVQCGNDLLCCTEYKVQYPAVLEAVRSGAISEERLNESVARILQWKFQLGLIG